MSNPDNQFETLTPEEFLTTWGAYLQGKVDKRGGTVPPEGSNTRLAASWCNLVDDLMLSVLNGSLGGLQTIVDNTATPLVIPSIGASSFANFEIDVPTTFNTLELLWLSVTRNNNVPELTNGGQLNIYLYSRSTRLVENKLIFTPIPEFGLDDPLDYGPSMAGKILRDAYAQELEEIVPGSKRLYGRAVNQGTGATADIRLAYAVRAFDLALTAITPKPTS